MSIPILIVFTPFSIRALVTRILSSKCWPVRQGSLLDGFLGLELLGSLLSAMAFRIFSPPAARVLSSISS
ncbi:hypothetical protein GH883_34875, partial [Bacillus thuringiensis]|nr:hypothetical protein [Bacillus thuringiensis]